MSGRRLVHGSMAQNSLYELCEPFEEFSLHLQVEVARVDPLPPTASDFQIFTNTDDFFVFFTKTKGLIYSSVCLLKQFGGSRQVSDNPSNRMGKRIHN